MDKAITELRVEELRATITNLVASVDALVKSPELTNTLASARHAADEYGALAQEASRNLRPAFASATNTLAQADATLTELKASVRNLNSLLSPDSALSHDLGLGLEQLTRAAQSIADLAEFLREHPNALVAGRETTSHKP